MIATHPTYTIVIHYYNNEDSIERHFQRLASFKADTLSRFNLILVDDCSQNEINFEDLITKYSLKSLNLRVLRVQDDIAWNQTGARNLGCYQAGTDWLFCTDIDHFLTENCVVRLSEVVALAPDQNTIYRVMRQHFENGSAIAPHTNTFLVNKNNFIRVGGYDEDFAGGAGHSDKYFFYLSNKAGFEVSSLSDVVIDVDPHAATKTLSRDPDRNRTLYLEKLAGRIPEKKTRINFKWGEAFLQNGRSFKIPETALARHAETAPATSDAGQGAELVFSESAQDSPTQRVGLTEERKMDLLRTVLNDRRSFFNRHDWLSTVELGRAVDRAGKPIPWMNYCFLNFIVSRLTPQLDVFEFGCGSSTIWFQQRVRSIISCEHDQAWIKEISPQLADNASVVFAPLKGEPEYTEQAIRTAKTFDIVIIDGRRRVECAIKSLPALSETGVYIWDNSNRDRYAEGFEFLIRSGFRKLDFMGLGPIANWETTTSVFYRRDNCLNL